MLGRECHDVAFAQSVMGVLKRDLPTAEFAALCAQVLSASIEPVDLLVGGVRDQRDLTDAVLVGERHPMPHGRLAGLVARVREVKLRAVEVVRHRPLRFPGPQRRPRPALRGVLSAADIHQLCHRNASGQPVEHPSWADRGELVAVADRDQLRPRALHQLGERIHAPVVKHPGLVHEHSRVPAYVDAAGARACNEGIERGCSPSERRAVGTEPLGRRPRDRYADGLAARVPLGSGGCVDHNALAGPSGTDKDRGALGPVTTPRA